MKRYALITLLSLIINASITNTGCCMDKEEKMSLEQLAIRAAKEEWESIEEHSLKADVLKNAYFDKTKIYKIEVTEGIEPSPTLLVAIDVDNNAYVFPSSKHGSDVKKFSIVMKKENIKINTSNVTSFINSFLFLLDFNSAQINSVDDMKYLPVDIQDEFVKEYKTIVSPPVCELFNKEKIKIIFYSWDPAGLLKRWKLTTLLNGEVLNCEIEEIANKIEQLGIE